MSTVSVLLALCLGVGPLSRGTLPAPRSQHPVFTGVWRLDLGASDSLDAMLKLEGVSSFKRRMMRTTVVTQTVEQVGNSLTIDVDSEHRHTVVRPILDGQPRPVTTPQGQHMVQEYSWSTDGRAVVTLARVSLKNGRPATLETRRRLDRDGTTLVMTVILRTEDATELRSLRVFRKEQTGGAS